MGMWAVGAHAADLLPASLREPFRPDEHTVVLYHFDEGQGAQTRDAMGDPALTLRAHKDFLWGKRPGFGSTARSTTTSWSCAPANERGPWKPGCVTGDSP